MPSESAPGSSAESNRRVGNFLAVQWEILHKLMRIVILFSQHDLGYLVNIEIWLKGNQITLPDTGCGSNLSSQNRRLGNLIKIWIP
ncbi:hypothetical protein N7447_001677 [Penicillium robsamsonii]|uniref:uncharacterized protein n=1 Tax=Penicillium robsamsonii TaxID=1792511 RepID=UPI0025490BFB|nr:uncharacterized protein N7447_001677 [Penicillium robsamsonii]KAJ5835651.1 hypothetical protein N7447_001677 [Penicillium robsamsonii]